MCRATLRRRRAQSWLEAQRLHSPGSDDGSPQRAKQKKKEKAKKDKSKKDRKHKKRHREKAFVLSKAHNDDAPCAITSSCHDIIRFLSV